MSIAADTVDLAVRALRAFAGAMTREQAARLLPWWAYYRDLTLPDRAAVLDRFPPRHPEPGSFGTGR